MNHDIKNSFLALGTGWNPVFVWILCIDRRICYFHLVILLKSASLIWPSIPFHFEIDLLSFIDDWDCSGLLWITCLEFHRAAETVKWDFDLYLDPRSLRNLEENHDFLFAFLDYFHALFLVIRQTVFLYLNLKFILSCCAIAFFHHFQLAYTQWF